jgi:uncharacterized protein YdaT
VSLKTKIKQLERTRLKRFKEWIRSLSDDELDKLCQQYTERDPVFSTLYNGWLKTLSDDEIETLCDEKPGARIIMRKFDEYKKQNQTAGKIQ